MHEQYSNQEQPFQEPERKFLVREIPDDLETYESALIDQGYIAIDENGTEVRLRDKAGRYSLTVKTAGEDVRGERETPLTEDQFWVLWPTTAGKRLRKVRYNIPLNEHLVELDVYQGDLHGLVVAEVEFDTMDELNAFDPPSWFGVEVTYIGGYKNKNLARFGQPPDFTG